MSLTLLLLLFIVALLYASVGHGGASGYLAVMALCGILPEQLKSSALILNLFVSLVAFLVFQKNVKLQWKVLLPFFITSIPFAFIGAGWHIPIGIYKTILGICLILAAIRMLWRQKSPSEIVKLPNSYAALLSGGLIGFISGLIGIGGGIILSPLLIINKWATVKESACISAVFIFVNSASGLFSMQLKHTVVLNPQIYSWIAVAFFGGLIGSGIGAYKIPNQVLKYVLCAVLSLAAFKLLV